MRSDLRTAGRQVRRQCTRAMPLMGGKRTCGAGSGMILVSVGNPDDASLGLCVVGVLHDRYIKVLLTFAECDIRRPIPGGDMENVQQLTFGRDLQNLPAEELGDIQIASAVDLEAIRPVPPVLDPVRHYQVKQSEARPVV